MRERPGVWGAESASRPTQQRKGSQDREPGQPQSSSCAGRWTAVSLLHLSLGRAEDERPPGHGVEPPAQLGPGVRAEVSHPPPRARLDRPLSPAVEALGTDVLWGLG